MHSNSLEIELTAGASRSKPRRAREKSPKSALVSPALGYYFVAPYAVLLVVFGIVPTAYALWLSFTSGDGSFAGFQNFSKVFVDYRFLPAVVHVALYIVIWLISLVALVILLALIVHGVGTRWLSTVSRFVFYIPGALAGASSVMLWLFVLNPTVSPVGSLLHLLGLQTLVQTISPPNLPLIFAIIAFWTGAGGWIVIMYGALNNVSTEVMEAARIDGANPFQVAVHIQLPLLRKWIAYMVIISLAAGTQLFVEPQLLSQASNAVVGNDYSLNQLSYLYAFQQNDFNGSAAISIILLVVALGLSSIFVTRGGLFEKD